jgi:hypothetical protein
MKKLLVILLLVSNFCFGQITITLPSGKEQQVCVPLVNATIFNATLTVGKLYLYIAISGGSDQYGTFTSSDGNNWQVVSQSGNNTRRIEVYRFEPQSTTSTDDLKSEWGFGHYPNSLYQAMYEVDGAQLGGNGANAIKQVVTDGTTGTDPSITMAALGQRNAVLSLFANSLNPFGGTPESGWTEMYDNGCSSPNGFYVMQRVNGADFTPTVTASSSDWIGVAIELRQSGRRVTLID